MINTNNYKLYLAQNNLNSENCIVGTFRKKDDPDFNCEIIMNTTAVQNAGFTESATTMFPDKAVIYVTVPMMVALRENDTIAMFNLYRELGHIECSHFEFPENYEEMTEEEQSGLMMKQEFEADAFAAEFIGKEEAISVLKQLLTLRAQVDRELGLNGTPSSVKQMRNYRARIQSLTES